MHFASYNSFSSLTGQKPLESKQEIILGPLQADKATKLTGSIFSEKTGTLVVEQTFEGFQAENWDISETIDFTEGSGSGFSVELLAPVVRVRFVNGENESGLRLYITTLMRL